MGEQLPNNLIFITIINKWYNIRDKGGLQAAHRHECVEDSFVNQTELRLVTVDIDRRGYGRRYTSLPVDELREDGFSIQFAGAYIRPDHIDVRTDDIVRWRAGEVLMQGRVIRIQRLELALHVDLADVVALPPDAFFP